MRLCSWTQAASSQWALGQIWQREKKKDVCVKGGVRDVVFTPKSKHKNFFFKKTTCNTVRHQLHKWLIMTPLG